MVCSADRSDGTTVRNNMGSGIYWHFMVDLTILLAVSATTLSLDFGPLASLGSLKRDATASAARDCSPRVSSLKAVF